MTKKRKIAKKRNFYAKAVKRLTPKVKASKKVYRRSKMRDPDSE